MIDDEEELIGDEKIVIALPGEPEAVGEIVIPKVRTWLKEKWGIEASYERQMNEQGEWYSVLEILPTR